MISEQSTGTSNPTIRPKQHMVHNDNPLKIVYVQGINELQL